MDELVNNIEKNEELNNFSSFLKIKLLEIENKSVFEFEDKLELERLFLSYLKNYFFDIDKIEYILSKIIDKPNILSENILKQFTYDKKIIFSFVFIYTINLDLIEFLIEQIDIYYHKINHILIQLFVNKENNIFEFQLIEENKVNETLYRVGKLISNELDIGKLIKSITHECQVLIDAEYSVFLYNVSENENDYVLYTATGFPIKTFEDFKMPKDTKIFDLTFKSKNIVRISDVNDNIDYINTENLFFSIKSYLAIPVISISGNIIGGLFFGHSQVNVFTKRDEQVISGIASQMSVAIDNASMYQKTSEAVSQFRLLTNTVPEIIWTADPDGYRDYFNNNWYKYTGLIHQHSEGWKWKSVIHPDDKKIVLEKWNQSIGNGEVYESSYRQKDSEQTYHWFLERAMPLKDDNGKIIKWFGSLTNIDDQIKNQEYLEKSNHELQQFAFISSHDLQEPLRIVNSYIQLLSKKYVDQLDSEAHEFINFAIDGINRMQSLVNDLQEYSNIVQRKVKFKPVDLEKVLENALYSLESQITDKNAKISHNKLPIINADEKQITALFQNIISNSIKYCKSQPTININVQLKYGEWVFSFKDNGIGIEPEYFEKIFLFFQRLHNRSIYQGTGMGLAICKKIVENHKGEIWVSSGYGIGSVFHFTIPIVNI
ncbi:MAG: PAS domain-containing protein [Candidatus Sericytochromatia bacterium]|nr:PAS domain-containing protein [Candidatus Sericytochromatia bacterium]